MVTDTVTDAPESEPPTAGTSTTPHDRLISLDDVLSMSVDARLVVLPALTDTTEPVVRGLGIQSMAQAFLRSGARSVLLSRWAAPDDGPDLAAAFLLGRALQGASDASALQATRRVVRGTGDAYEVTLADGTTQSVSVAHPHVWAGWLLVGDR